MGVFGAFFGCRGDAGFKSPLLGASSGVLGFNVAMLLRLVREKVRPAWSDGGRERKKVRPAHSKHPKIGVFRRCAGLGCSAVHFRLAADGGFAALEALPRRVVGVSES